MMLDDVRNRLIISIVLISLFFMVIFIHKKILVIKSNKISAKTSISYAKIDSCNQKSKILIVHHNDNPSDLFWQEVTNGFKDAEKITNSELTVMGNKSMISSNALQAKRYDGLIITIPFSSESSEYKELEISIQTVIDSQIPVITFNTDTFHNKDVFMYIGSFNKLLGVRGARLAHKKFENENIRKVAFLFQETFNVTLEWRADSFEQEYSSFYKGIKFIRFYDNNIDKYMKEEKEKVLLVPLGVMRMQTAVNLKIKYPDRVLVCEVGDTGKEVSKLSREYNIPYVGQQAYHQGYSSVTSMNNIIKNYAKGKAWSREKGNSANTVEATYECTGENCNNEQTENSILDSERKIRSEWIQIGIAICMNRLDIAAWNEYKPDRIGKENTVYLWDGSQVNQTIVDFEKNFEGELEGKNGQGALDEFLKYYPLYERSLDSVRNKYEYFIIVDNGTRIPLSGKNGVARLRSGMFLRLKYAHITYKIVLYDEDDLENIQSILVGSLGNSCKPCK